MTRVTGCENTVVCVTQTARQLDSFTGGRYNSQVTGDSLPRYCVTGYCGVNNVTLHYITGLSLRLPLAAGMETVGCQTAGKAWGLGHHTVGKGPGHHGTEVRTEAVPVP